MYRTVRLAPLITLLGASLIIGCSADSERAKPASQVVVKVNKDEISVHQLNELLARGGNISADQVKQASAAALERLIDQELMVQQARDRKLDRDPKVMQAIETARREILARAYAEQVAGMGPRPTGAQVSAFYAENPGLFSKRRVYNIQELSVRIPTERVDELRQQVQSADNLHGLAAWLNEQAIPFTATAGVKPAEQLPLEMLGPLSKMKEGQVAINRTPVGVSLILIEGARDEPIDEVRARPFIEQYLTAQARTELARAEIKRLRQIASIEYVGDFADKAPAAVADTPAIGNATAPAVASTTSTDSALRAALEKGAAGLK